MASWLVHPFLQGSQLWQTDLQEMTFRNNLNTSFSYMLDAVPVAQPKHWRYSKHWCQPEKITNYISLWSFLDTPSDLWQKWCGILYISSPTPVNLCNYIRIYLHWKKLYYSENKMFQMQCRGTAERALLADMLSTAAQLYKNHILKGLQRCNVHDLDSHSRPPEMTNLIGHILLPSVVCSILHHVWDITIFTVYVAICNLEKYFSFDMVVKITDHICFLIHR